ncbi:CoA transferase [Plantibacter sp. YIM 135249]|uniref:CoA transferase n=1 Tax=Plantibacter sp. YIM 135249 TaxID=3423918 RepID=UPI003D32B06D
MERSTNGDLASDYRASLGVSAPTLPRAVIGSEGYLAARLPVLPFAMAAVGTVEDAADRLRAALGLGGPDASRAPATVDRERVAAAYQSDKLLRFDDVPVSAFAALSGFFRAADGWIRTHANYPHHHDRLCRVLGLHGDAGRADLELAVSLRTASDLEEAAAAAGALAVRVRSAAEWMSGSQWASLVAEPLVRVSGAGAPPGTRGDSRRRDRSRGSGEGHGERREHGAGGQVRASDSRHGQATARFPLAGVRVLDLTRVIAGPVATRTLALLGADVLRVDSPRLPEIPWQHVDTGQGKRTVSVDAATPAGVHTLQALLDTADVLVTGYRPGAVETFGLRRPEGLVEASVDAWGGAGPWRDRRGFDSLVQAASGIAVIEGSVDSPGALPAQALDHSSGYLLAAAVIDSLAERLETGSGRRVAVSLARIGAALFGAGLVGERDDSRGDPGVPGAASPASQVGAAASGSAAVPGHESIVTNIVDGVRITTARPALAGYDDYAFPAHRLGSDTPEWAERTR